MIKTVNDSERLEISNKTSKYLKLLTILLIIWIILLIYLYLFTGFRPNSLDLLFGFNAILVLVLTSFKRSYDLFQAKHKRISIFISALGVSSYLLISLLIFDIYKF